MNLPRKVICNSELLEKKWLNQFYYTLRFAAPLIAESCLPGQFVNLRLSKLFDPLLPRPMSIYRCNREEGWIEFLLKVVGKGTRTFAEGRKGDRFGLLGPLGNGFDVNSTETAILIGGGIGIAPLIFLAEELQKSGIDAHFIQGFKTQDELCCLEEISGTAGSFQIATDDGTYGFHGDVAECLKALLEDRSDLQGATAFVCGPNSMMHAISQVCLDAGISAQLSAEAHMACGFGVCVGCPLPRSDEKGYYLTCVDGPVFRLGEVSFVS